MDTHRFDRLLLVRHHDGVISTDDATPDAPFDQAPDAPGTPVGLVERVELSAEVIAVARAAAWEDAGQEAGGVESVGEFLGAHTEDDVAVTAAFAARIRGYHGWLWSVTLARVTAQEWTVSEVVLLPGDEALVAPLWVPWDQRVRGGDLNPGDLLPAPADDLRLVPGYVLSDDPAVREVAREIGLGRERVLSLEGRLDAAERWHEGSFGPSDPMAQQAPGCCGQCGFFVPLAGSLGGMFGACANEMGAGDGRIVAVEYGCGAHSEAAAAVVEPALQADPDGLRVDEMRIDVHVRDAPAPLDAVPETSADVAATDLGGTDPVAPDDVADDGAAADPAVSADDGSDHAAGLQAVLDLLPPREDAEPAGDALEVQDQADLASDGSVSAD